MSDTTQKFGRLTPDQWGNTTYYFYNEDNQLRFSVNALGEVNETRYNTLGEVTDVLAYSNRLSDATLATVSSIGGGLLNSLLATVATRLSLVQFGEACTPTTGSSDPHILQMPLRIVECCASVQHPMIIHHQQRVSLHPNSLSAAMKEL